VNQPWPLDDDLSITLCVFLFGKQEEEAKKAEYKE